ncbi:hypothetical protein, partial [Streptomyces albus]
AGRFAAALPGEPASR